MGWNTSDPGTSSAGPASGKSATSGARYYYAVPTLPKDSAATAEMDISERIEELRLEMFAAAEDLRFEYAAKLRDELKELRRELQAAAEAAA